MSFYLKLAAFCAVFMVIFGLIGLLFDEPARMAIAGLLPGVGVGYGFLTVRERDARMRARKAALAEAQAEEAGMD
ncbi:MAG: hypothetical protein OEM67_08955 [Thermoleophilia bacterium]|nr:hypothetical protein [Thermoleophilia bacterium]MDH3725452.1 hypothetical protein [Thermoleophilia bacterium]